LYNQSLAARAKKLGLRDLAAQLEARGNNPQPLPYNPATFGTGVAGNALSLLSTGMETPGSFTAPQYITSVPQVGGLEDSYRRMGYDRVPQSPDLIGA